MKVRNFWFVTLPFAIVVVGCHGGETSAVASDVSTKPASSTPLSTLARFADIQPVFNANCTGCHGSNRPRQGIMLTDYASVTKGGKEGPIIKPGMPADSKLVQALEGTHGASQMPPKGAKLPPSTIAKIKDWIKGGAKDS